MASGGGGGGVGGGGGKIRTRRYHLGAVKPPYARSKQVRRGGWRPKAHRGREGPFPSAPPTAAPSAARGGPARRSRPFPPPRAYFPTCEAVGPGFPGGTSPGEGGGGREGEGFPAGAAGILGFPGARSAPPAAPARGGILGSFLSPAWPGEMPRARQGAKAGEGEGGGGGWAGVGVLSPAVPLAAPRFPLPRGGRLCLRAVRCLKDPGVNTRRNNCACCLPAPVSEGAPPPPPDPRGQFDAGLASVVTLQI